MHILCGVVFIIGQYLEYMDITFFSDTHGKHNEVKLQFCDILIFGGDMSVLGTEKEITDFMKWFKAQNSIFKILIAGNHDIPFDIEKQWAGYGTLEKRRPNWLSDLLDDYTSSTNCYYLENSSINIWGYQFYGSPIVVPTSNSEWGFVKSGVEADLIYSQIPPDTDFVISHTPPRGIMDYSMQGSQHCGSIELLRYLKIIKPKYLFCGHIHEGYGYSVLNTKGSSIHCYNGSIVDRKGNMANKPWELAVGGFNF
jgi:Icc-related predicted phosphoesterase